MTCNCVKTVNENLKSHNTRLSLGFSMTQDYGVISRLLIQTEKADKNSRVKMTSVAATFCPFCGVKFNGCAFGEETTCVKSVDAT